MSSVRLEAVARETVEIPLQPASFDIWDKKYRLTSKRGDAVDETIEVAGVTDSIQETVNWLRAGTQAGDQHDQLHRVRHHHRFDG